MNIIKVKNLSKHFKKNKAVDDISFSVEKGKIFAFLGPNGAGKSTTIKMLTTVLHPTKGKIKVNGFSLSQSHEIRESIGIIFQDPSLDDELTAYENLEFHAVLYHVPKNKIKQEIKKALQLVDLEDRKNDFVKTFSGGMKRRLEIGRALIHKPKLLFLDEPTTGLDAQTTNKIWEYIKKLNKEDDMSIFLTTHNMTEAEEVAQEIAIIDHGKIIMQDSLENIKKKTNSRNLEQAYLNLTGKDIRQQNADALSKMRMRTRLRR